MNESLSMVVTRRNFLKGSLKVFSALAIPGTLDNPVTSSPPQNELQDILLGVTIGATTGGFAGGAVGMLLADNNQSEIDNALPIALAIWGMLGGAVIGFFGERFISSLKKPQNLRSFLNKVQAFSS